MYKDASAKIIEILSKDASLTNREIGERMGLPTTTIHNKIRKLERDGILRKYVAVFDRQKIGLPITAVIAVNTSLSGGEKGSHREIAERIRRLGGRIECIMSVTGDYDLIVRVSVANTKELNDLVTKLRRIDGVVKTVTHVVLEELLEYP